jgi:hypothetical protein
VVCRLPTEPRSSSGGWNRTSGLHVQSVALLPAVTAPESSSRFGKEDSNLHHLIQSQAACRLADSRVESVSRELNPPIGLGKPVPGRSARDASLIDRHITSERDRGIEPRSPGWKPGVVPLDQSRSACRPPAEGEGVEPSRLIARLISNQVPSPVGLPFRVTNQVMPPERSVART